MFIIWGSKNKVKEIGVSYMDGTCMRCNNISQRGIIQHQEWFTIFWIPIFPISKKKYYKICAICGQAEMLTQEEAFSYQNQQVFEAEQ